MEFTEMEKKIPACMHDQPYAPLQKETEGVVLIEEMMTFFDDGPTDEEIAAYRSLVKKKLIFDFRRADGKRGRKKRSERRYVMTVERSKLEQLPDIIEGKALEHKGSAD